MTYVKINDTLYPATINGSMNDSKWDGRASKSITLKMDYVTASNLFVDGLEWSIIQKNEIIIQEPVYEVDENGDIVLAENGEYIQIGSQPKTEIQESEWDNSEYNLAGDLTDHRDGTITVKMGKLTDLEQAYEIMLGGM